MLLWPEPVWGKIPPKPYSNELKGIVVEKLRGFLKNNFTFKI